MTKPGNDEIFAGSPHKPGDKVWVDVGFAKLKGVILDRIGFSSEDGFIYVVRLERGNQSSHSDATITPRAAIDQLGELADG